MKNKSRPASNSEGTENPKDGDFLVAGCVLPTQSKCESEDKRIEEQRKEEAAKLKSGNESVKEYERERRK